MRRLINERRLSACCYRCFIRPQRSRHWISRAWCRRLRRYRAGDGPQHRPPSGRRSGVGQCGRCGRSRPDVFWRGRQADGTGSAFAPECYLDADLAQEGCRPASRPARARGAFGQLLLFRCVPPTCSARPPRSSVPVHSVRVVIQRDPAGCRPGPMAGRAPEKRRQACKM
jgi:hypothetical protein